MLYAKLTSVRGRAHLFALALIAIWSAACGGGGGSAPAPPNYPSAVEDITEEDLLAAGIPTLPLTASAVRSLSHGGSGAEDCERTETVDKNETISIHNLVPTPDGFTTDVPADTTSRIIAWAMWQLPVGEGERLREVTLNVDAGPGLRLFFAIGNFTRGRWEPFGRVGLNIPDGTSNTILFSTGQRYNRADGPGYLLMAVGHPGNGDMSFLNIKLEDILISSFDVSCLREGFEEGTVGSVDWQDDHLTYTAQQDGGGLWRIRQDFGPPAAAGESPLLFLMADGSVRMLSDGSVWDDTDIVHVLRQQLAGDWNGDGIDTIGYYSSQEANGPRHPFTLRASDGNQAVSLIGAPLVTPPGGTEPSAIIAILIGLLGNPVPGAEVSITAGDSIVLKTGQTNARGEFTLDGVNELEPGTYSLSLNFEEVKVTYVLNLLEEEGIFYYFLTEPAVE